MSEWVSSSVDENTHELIIVLILELTSKDIAIFHFCITQTDGEGLGGQRTSH